jgi:hypothetical protein
MINEERLESVKIYNGASHNDDIVRSANGTSLVGYVRASFNDLVNKLGRTILIDEWESDGKVFNEWILDVEVEEQLEEVFYRNPNFHSDGLNESQRFLSCHEDDVPLNTNYWHDSTEHEFVITIYDWKEEHNMIARGNGGDAIYDWHIGCESKYSNVAEQIILDLLDDKTEYIEVV